MNKLSFVAVAALLAAGIQTTRAQQTNAQTEKQLASAQHKATIDGDLKGAIEEYKKIVAGAAANRALAAQALLRMAECYQKLGDAEAGRIYERIVHDYGDQMGAVAIARAQLDGGGRRQAKQIARQIWNGDGLDAYGSFSADGRYLTYTDWETGDLALRDLMTKAGRRLTKTGGIQTGSGSYAESPVFSPDGGQVAYLWFERGYELRVVPVGGENANPRIVVPRGDPEYVEPFGWTPDGTQLLAARLFRDGASQLVMVSVKDGTIRTLKSLQWRYPRKVSLSPDGRYIAYDIPGEGGAATRDIFVLAADGSAESTVVQSAADDFYPMWSPDGSQLVFLSDRNGADALWRVPIRNGKAASTPSLLKMGMGRILPRAITGDGTLYYFAGGPRRNIHIAELDRTLQVMGTPVVASERFVDISGRGSWSHDGASLAYYSFRGDPSDRIGSAGLVIQSMTTGEEREVPLQLRLSTAENVPPPRWFPDGRSVLVAALDQRSAAPRTGYYRVDISTGHAELLHSSQGTGRLARNPDLSRDGKALYYGEGTLVRVDLANGHATDVIPSAAGIISFAISPDGSQLGYVLADSATGSAALMVVPAAGGQGRQVARVTPWNGISRYGTLGWTADGRHLLFFRAEAADVNPELFQVPLAGGEPVKVGISLAEGRLSYPQMHPDGRRITYWSRQRGTNELWALENLLPPAPSANKR